MRSASHETEIPKHKKSQSLGALLQKLLRTLQAFVDLAILRVPGDFDFLNLLPIACALGFGLLKQRVACSSRTTGPEVAKLQSPYRQSQTESRDARGAHWPREAALLRALF